MYYESDITRRKLSTATFFRPGSRAPWIFQNPGRPFYRALKSKIGTKNQKLKVKKKPKKKTKKKDKKINK